MKKMYRKVQIDETDEDDMAVDTSGYTGNFHRFIDESAFTNYTFEDLALLIHKNNKLVDIMRKIKEIDKEHNGYVTSTELDDILKLTYKELASKNLKQMFKSCASIQNKILIDYKRVRDLIQEAMKKINLKEVG